MFQGFHLRHIPALIAGSSMAFGGMWPLFNAQAAMLEFGLPAPIANAPAAAPVMVVGNVRTTIVGILMLLFYFRQQMDIVDTCMAVTGGYAGLVDCYVLWKEGNRSQAIFRLISSWLISAWGLFGMTAGR